MNINKLYKAVLNIAISTKKHPYNVIADLQSIYGLIDIKDELALKKLFFNKKDELPWRFTLPV